MKDAVAKWIEFRDHGIGEVGDFVSLLSGRRNSEELDSILRGFAEADSVKTNLQQVYDKSQDLLYRRPKPELAADGQKLCNILGRFLDSQRKHLLGNSTDEFVINALSATARPPRYVGKLPEVDPNNSPEVCIRIEDGELLRFKDIPDLQSTTTKTMEYRRLAGIREALYGLAADYYLAWYVLLPICDTDVDYSSYFEFWVAGGVYEIIENEVLVGSIWA